MDGVERRESGMACIKSGAPVTKTKTSGLLERNEEFVFQEAKVEDELDACWIKGA